MTGEYWRNPVGEARCLRGRDRMAPSAILAIDCYHYFIQFHLW